MPFAFCSCAKDIGVTTDRTIRTILTLHTVTVLSDYPDNPRLLLKMYYQGFPHIRAINSPASYNRRKLPAKLCVQVGQGHQKHDKTITITRMV